MLLLKIFFRLENNVHANLILFLLCYFLEIYFLFKPGFLQVYDSPRATYFSVFTLMFEVQLLLSA